MITNNPHHARRWTILAILAIAQLMVVLDATIVNIALPSAQRALHFPNSGRQWIVTAYALAFGSLLLLGGRISICSAESGRSSPGWPDLRPRRRSAVRLVVRDARRRPRVAGRVRGAAPPPRYR